jgi:hypothetical protein
MGHHQVADERLGRQPRNRPPANVVAAGDLAERFPAGLDALGRLVPLMRRKGRPAAKPDTVRLGAGASLGWCGRGISSRSNSARPPSTVNIKRPCVVVVSAHASPSDRKLATMLRRSRVDRARRSRRVTMRTSPASSWSRTRRSWARSVFAPLAVSRHTFSAPAARDCLACPSRLWPSVDTRA